MSAYHLLLLWVALYEVRIEVWIWNQVILVWDLIVFTIVKCCRIISFVSSSSQGFLPFLTLCSLYVYCWFLYNGHAIVWCVLLFASSAKKDFPFFSSVSRGCFFSKYIFYTWILWEDNQAGKVRTFPLHGFYIWESDQVGNGRFGRFFLFFIHKGKFYW